MPDILAHCGEGLRIRMEDRICRRGDIALGGSLRIYMGYAAGVGKTYAMLQEGHRLMKRGIDVVIGYIEPHSRPDVAALVVGLEHIPRRFFSTGDSDVSEMDTPAILRRQPQIVLIDELAHTNHAGAERAKRYEEVLEILDQGIDVLSTLNIQDLDSIADKVSETVQIPIQERIPDWILRRADQTVIVDVGMEELRERVRFGKVFEKTQAELELQNFYTYENLSFLREMMLQEVASDQARKIEEQERKRNATSGQGEKSVMVALSPYSIHSEALLRKAARLAYQLSSRCYAVYIQKGGEDPTDVNSARQRIFQNNLKLAKALRAEVVTIEAKNIAEALVTFSGVHHVKHVVFGKPWQTPIMARIKGSLILEFINGSVGVDVHIITTAEGERKRDLAPNA